MSLADKRCVPCEGGVEPASEDEIARMREQVPDWRVEEVDGVKHLRRWFLFPDFVSALAFTHRVGEIAEEQGHHPLIATEWGKVTVDWWTHAIGGLHENDFVMAARTDRIDRP
jgi:4a-hydroxytetrahydrobiopterin dehydratase